MPMPAEAASLLPPDLRQSPTALAVARGRSAC
jgi:hypothetical protein